MSTRKLRLVPPAGLPPLTAVKHDDTHRLIPSKHMADGASVLTRIADDDAHLVDIFDLDHATNERLRGEHNLLSGIGVDELVFAVPYARIVNAAFCHAHPLGSRFNGPDRGAWYSALDRETAIAEVAFHKTVQLSEIGRFEDEVTYDDYLSDIHAELHDIRISAATGSSVNPALKEVLAPDSYVASQLLAARLLDLGALGIIYPSVRNSGGVCIACFRPAIVGNVRRGETLIFRWSGTPTAEISSAPS